MVFLLTNLLMLNLSSNIIGAHASTTFTFETNPFIKHTPSSDPDGEVYDGTVWLYTSSDANLTGEINPATGLPFTPGSASYNFMDGYHAFSTTDMINWTDHGQVFHSSMMNSALWPTNMPAHMLWAPGAARRVVGGTMTYFLYYPKDVGSGNFVTGVASAPNPWGPFTDQGPVKHAATGTYMAMDPAVFMDDATGDYYIYSNTLRVAKLNPDMKSLAEEPRWINYDQTNAVLAGQGFGEGSWMHKRNGIYYYSYSNSDTADYSGYYCTGNSPYGPFTFRGPIVRNNHVSQDHHSTVVVGGQWYYFSHSASPAENLVGWIGERRVACYEKMYYNADGTIQVITPKFGNGNYNCGGLPYDGGVNNKFGSDASFNGGGTGSTANPIANTTDDALYQTYRFGNCSYNLPVDNGNYEVVLKFAEVYFNNANARKFNVQIEGSTVISNLDIWTAAGGKDKAYDQIFTVPVTDGTLNINFVTVLDNAAICAIKTTKIMGGTSTPTPTLAPTATPTPTTAPSGAALSRTGWSLGLSGTWGNALHANALDGVASTRWDSGAYQANGQNLVLDMGSAQTFNKLVMDTTASANDYPVSYQVFVSTDGTTWGSAIATGTGSTITNVNFSTQTKRYIKIVQTGTSSSSYWSVHELNVYSPSGATPTPTPTPAATATPTPTPTPSSTAVELDYTGWTNTGTNVAEMGNMFDKNIYSRWVSGAPQTNGQYIQFDMKSSMKINKIVLDATLSPNDYPKGYNVFVSNDGTNWGSAIASGVGQATTTITFTEQTVRYFKIVQTGSDPSNYWSIHELEVYGPAGLSRTGWTITSANNNGSTPNVKDANSVTRWDTGTNQANGQYLTIDMGTATTFKRILMNHGSSVTDFPVGYALYVSTDGTNWGTAIKTGVGTFGKTTIALTTAQTKRYIKIVQTGTSASTYWAVHELNAFAN